MLFIRMKIKETKKREYEPEVLRRIQQTELSILKDFAAVCEEHGLTWFAIGGTTIGAVRHDGFIPWDDDIDVAMPREDYEKLLVIMERDHGDKYRILNTEHYENFPLMTTRICLKGTRFKEYALRDIKAPLGIFLDLYAYDKVSDKPAQARKQAWDAWFWSKLLILRSIPHPVLPMGGLKAKIIQLICGAVHMVLKGMHVSKLKIYKKAYEATTRYNHLKKTERLNYICDTSPYVSTYYVKDIFPLQKHVFEDMEVYLPKNYDRNLKGMFGDYMQLPPEDKRKSHYPYELKFRGEKTVVNR